MYKFYICTPIYAQMVELVDTRVSKTRIARCAGSTPALGTKNLCRKQRFFYFNGILALGGIIPKNTLENPFQAEPASNQRLRRLFFCIRSVAANFE
jgi:hypothetical protein